MKAALYILGLALLFTHELDAVTHAEWRLLFGLRGLPDAEASTRFVALHVPFFFAILWPSHHPQRRLREGTRVIVAACLPVHAGLHFGLSSHEDYGFHGPLSEILIFGAGGCGIAYLVATWIQRSQPDPPPSPLT